MLEPFGFTFAPHAALVLRVDEPELQRYRAVLGVGPEVTSAVLEKAYLNCSFAAIRSGSAEQRAMVQTAYVALSVHLRTKAASAGTRSGSPAVATATLPAAGSAVATAPRPTPLDSVDLSAGTRPPFAAFSFDDGRVNLVALPAILGLAALINATPLVGLLRGFHLWVHEFGHATLAWLAGYRALPLPFGWTNVETERANFVYFGVLFLLAVLFWTGWKERKIWPMILALVIAPLQYHLTWRMPEHRAEVWLAFTGIGGEFYLGTVCLVLFPVHLPDKFRWGVCRYVFAFLGASTFLNVLVFWRRVQAGDAGIPYGSMVGGEEFGDMNVLRDLGWSEQRISAAYNQLGLACAAVILVVYLVFACRLDRPLGRGLERLWPESWN